MVKFHSFLHQRRADGLALSRNNTQTPAVPDAYLPPPQGSRSGEKSQLESHSVLSSAMCAFYPICHLLLLSKLEIKEQGLPDGRATDVGNKYISEIKTGTNKQKQTRIKLKLKLLKCTAALNPL